ncbi:MAG TPA: diguanylate cyclase [Burkholderiales bacterium]|nr:diguanylate cyclase [Burkholderiales bacterium]
MATPTDLPQKRVLVVDDSKFVRTTFASILKASFGVREEADGEAAWDAVVGDASLVMVFTDLDMPKLDGFGLLSRIRASSDRRIKEMPVVVISGNEAAAMKQRARELGANDFIAKSADAPEVLSRLDNLLRLARTSNELEVTRKVVGSTATHDPLTGTHTPHYLVTEGRKHFAAARRHGGELSVMALRLDTYDEIALAAGKDIADVVVQRVAKLITDKVRAEDTVARVAYATFMVVAAGTAASHMTAVAQRLRRELDDAKVRYRDQPLKFVSSVGVASASMDAANSIEDLMRLALQRVQRAPAAAPTPAAAPAAQPAGMPADLERILRFLEGADIARIGPAADEFARRLERIAKAIQAKRR